MTYCQLVDIVRCCILGTTYGDGCYASRYPIRGVSKGISQQNGTGRRDRRPPYTLQKISSLLVSERVRRKRLTRWAGGVIRLIAVQPPLPSWQNFVPSFQHC